MAAESQEQQQKAPAACPCSREAFTGTRGLLFRVCFVRCISSRHHRGVDMSASGCMRAAPGFKMIHSAATPSLKIKAVAEPAAAGNIPSGKGLGRRRAMPWLPLQLLVQGG
uniref:Uncharacterized protein n=1 Tax=Anas platyrhynchos TaxID=8839 RepID=A0A8B9SG85_ANAPL